MFSNNTLSEPFPSLNKTLSSHSCSSLPQHWCFDWNLPNSISTKVTTPLHYPSLLPPPKKKRLLARISHKSDITKPNPVRTINIVWEPLRITFLFGTFWNNTFLAPFPNLDKTVYRTLPCTPAPHFADTDTLIEISQIRLSQNCSLPPPPSKKKKKKHTLA